METAWDAVRCQLHYAPGSDDRMRAICAFISIAAQLAMRSLLLRRYCEATTSLDSAVSSVDFSV